MAYFPMFVDLAECSGLIVGGGTVALRKVEKLLPYGPRLTVVAPTLLPELFHFPIHTVCRAFCSDDLTGADFVIAASDDREVNRTVAALCRERGIPVNAVDDKQACTFLFPALVRRGELSVGISTGGSSPTAAVWLKEQISALLPPRLDEILLWLEEQRPRIKARCPEEAVRSRLFTRMFQACLEQGAPLTDAQLADLLEQEVEL